MRVPEMLIMLIGVLLLEATAAAEAQPVVGCEERCGNASIPYPFGTTPDCYYNQNFLITCNNTFDPPKPFLRRTNLEVTNISKEGKLHIMQFIAKDCYNEAGEQVSNNQSYLSVPGFTISDTDNKFIGVGSNGHASIQGEKGMLGCISICSDIDYHVANYSCPHSCCRTSIPKGWDYFKVKVSNYYLSGTKIVWGFSPCSYAFVVEESKFNYFSSGDLSTYFQDVEKLPVVLDWSIGNETCQALQQKNMTTACQGNTACYNPDNGSGYRCKCLEGYQGNPYLGCLDIDEFKDPNLNECMHNTICKNTVGNYRNTVEMEEKMETVALLSNQK